MNELAFLILGILIGATLAAFVAHYLTSRLKRIFAEQVRWTLKRQTALIHAAAHELRTPLGNILGLVRELRTTESAGSAFNQGVIEELAQSGNSLNRMLLDVLEIFEHLEGALEIDMQTVNLTDLIQAHVEFLKSKSSKEGASVNIAFEQAEPLWVETDPTRIRQCLTALITQAAFQSDNGQISIALRERHEGEGPSRVFIKISDDSPGVVQSAADCFFAPEDYQENPYLRGRPAAMLALNLAASIARRLNGALVAKSAIGAGVTFMLRFTARRAASASIAQQIAGKISAGQQMRAQSQTVDARNAVAGAHVLVVDDNEINLRVLTAMMQPFDLGGLETASSGQEAIAKAKDDRFDLIFMDIQMPNMDGFAATKAIRAIDMHYARIPVIAVSATSRIVNRQSCKTAGLDGYIEKPVNTETLAVAIRRVAKRVLEIRQHAA